MTDIPPTIIQQGFPGCANKSQVAPSNRPPYPKVGHDGAKIASAHSRNYHLEVDLKNLIVATA